MFSNMTDITEAWDRDPVKGMTKKISDGIFDADRDKNKTIYKFKNDSKDLNSLSLSDNYSLSSKNSLSFNPKLSLDSDISNVLPSNFNKRGGLKNNILNLSEIINSDSSFTENGFNTKCEHSIKHIKKCNKCYDQLKKIVDNKVIKKMDEIILDNKLKQIQAFTPNLTQQNTPQNISQNTHSVINPDSWKETLVIVIGVIIALFIIFLIIKAICK
ncbi:hypothetical protein H012_gp559 [Acanthamoeba polyphaga moumouvirus]|uniref:Uncharacterized protein n=2 Tax=Moumouvirus TaxID=3080801 RepID=L7RCX0_9VIRU|nr:hypothetical protein H012_gp559 [Acanthamoeba polyphaga moumouvirus]AEX62860.1 hypothetical protein mv_L655 [Moumouvirus Monve]AGC01903.1 hypothetical protein Moumou_00365 [Acanthamoeba polyphaga moumouvirus]AQN68263.1 hypothetical protein [Saudi moumouvirus]